jgi:hypothetical protein
MQRSVRWFMTTDEDRRFARERLAVAEQKLATLRGQSFGVTRPAIPFEVPAELVDAQSGNLPMYFLRPEELADASAFVQRHLAAACVARGLTAREFLEAYRPFAVLGASSSAELGKPGLYTTLVDGDGDVFVVRGPGSGELFWVGYLEVVLELQGA